MTVQMRFLIGALALLGAGIASPAAWAQQVTSSHAIALHGTPKYGPDFKHFDYANPDAPKGGTMRLGGFGGFDTLNGFTIKGEAADGLGLIYDGLLVSSADEPFTEYGLLVETIDLPEDRSWIAFHLRSEARWHDGKPVTAGDVMWSFETLMAKGAPFYRFYYANVDKVEALDEKTVKFSFKPGENRELALIVGQIPVLPKHYWEGRDFEATTLEPPLGSGPYRIKSFEPGRYIAYERVPDYWGQDVPAVRGFSNFDEIRYEYFRDDSVAVEAFKGGAFDFRAENVSKIWATAYDIPAVDQGIMVKEIVPHQNTAPIQGYVYNTRRDLFKDKRVRQALAYAFDFEWSNRNLFYGQYKQTRSYFGNSELEAKGLPEGAELEILERYRGRIPDEVFTAEYNPPATKGDGRIRDNLREADRLLKEAGWEIKDGKRIHAETGQTFEFEIMLVQPMFERITLPFAKNLERLGITANVRTVDTAQYIQRLETFDFDMVTGAWGQSLSPGNEQRNYWGTEAASQNGSRNLPGISDPVVDELIELLIAAPDRESLVARTRALDRVLQWGHYLIPHWYAGYDRIVYWNKFSRPDIIPPYGFTTSVWWHDPDKAARVDQGLNAGQPK